MEEYEKYIGKLIFIDVWPLPAVCGIILEVKPAGTLEMSTKIKYWNCKGAFEAVIFANPDRPLDMQRGFDIK